MAPDPTSGGDVAAPSVPGYRLFHAIGRGTFGEVWLAEELLTGLHRAVKVLAKSARPPAASPLRELAGVREYQQKSKDHPSLLQIYHVGETAECYFYAMELADPIGPRTSCPPEAEGSGAGVQGSEAGEQESGEQGSEIQAEGPTANLQSAICNLQSPYVPLTLAAVIAQDAPMPAARALDITAQVLRGLEHLHTQGLIHRDVKPANVLFVDGRVKLGDLGLVTSLDRDVTQVGTPGYMPPDAKIDHTADLYAAGIMLYEMITGLHRSKFPELPILKPQTRRDRRTLRAAIRIANKAAHPDKRQRFTAAARMLAEGATRRARVLTPRRGLVVGATALSLLTALGLWAFRPRPRLAFASNDEKHENVLNLSYSDGSSGFVTFPCPVSRPQRFDVDGDGHWRVAVGTRATAQHPGGLIIVDPMAFHWPWQEPRWHEPPISPPSIPWAHQPFESKPRVTACVAQDLDGVLGQELVLALVYDEGPTCIRVMTRGWRCLSEYWHYGNMTDVRTVDLDRDPQALPELVVLGFANKRTPEPPFKAIAEPLHQAVLVLNPREPYPPNARWSMNPWMNSHPAPPMAYGVLTRDKGAGGGVDCYCVFLGTELREHPTAPIRIHFQNGIILALTNQLAVDDFRPDSSSKVAQDALPSASDIWQRLYPVDAAVGEASDRGHE